jgi:hypothetical protein
MKPNPSNTTRYGNAKPNNNHPIEEHSSSLLARPVADSDLVYNATKSTLRKIQKENNQSKSECIRWRGTSISPSIVLNNPEVNHPAVILYAISHAKELEP